MKRAILIAGDEGRFTTDLREFEKYLREDCQMKDITFIRAENMVPTVLEEILEEKILSADGPILLIYSGHGNKKGWAYGSRFSYATLTPLLAKAKQPLFFINNCCHSFSVATVMSEYAWQNAVGLLTAGPADKTSYDFLYEVIKSWKKREVYDPRDYKFYNGGLVNPLPWREEAAASWCQIYRYGFLHLLHRIFPRYFKPTLFLKSKVIFPTYHSTPEDIVKERILTYEDRPRWGQAMDHYFFAHA